MRLRVWSGQQDLNLRPPAPKAGALPGCAMPRGAQIVLPTYYFSQLFCGFIDYKLVLFSVSRQKATYKRSLRRRLRKGIVIKRPG